MSIVPTFPAGKVDTPTVWAGDVVETFAGPGGWSEALRALGIEGAVGYEWDADACATAEAAGHKRVQADVADVDLSLLPRGGGYIGSPPCQSFSPAGKQLGKLDRPRLDFHVARIAHAGEWIDYPRDGWHDPRSALVLEPLRWVLTLRPEWVALEQVPAVLPLWEAYAAIFTAAGYHCATGVLSSEQFGVPQTRKRAFLIASLSGPVSLPAPTHRPYRKGVTRDAGDAALLPWVSMADALGWTEGGLVGFPRRPDSCAGHAPPEGGQCAKHRDDDLVDFDGVLYKRRDLRLTEEPAKALTEKARSWQLRQSAMPNATVRLEDEPAPTITAGHDRAERVWEPAEGPTELHPAGVLAADREGRARVSPRAEDEPAPTITGSGRHSGYWAEQRPATTVQGDARIWPPGHKVNGDDRARLGEVEANERYGDRAGTVSVEEAAVLQSFRPDYPWQGSKTARYRQVGDAVPPVLAEAVLRSVIA